MGGGSFFCSIGLFVPWDQIREDSFHGFIRSNHIGSGVEKGTPELLLMYFMLIESRPVTIFPAKSPFTTNASKYVPPIELAKVSEQLTIRSKSPGFKTPTTAPLETSELPTFLGHSKV